METSIRQMLEQELTSTRVTLAEKDRLYGDTLRHFRQRFKEAQENAVTYLPIEHFAPEAEKKAFRNLKYELDVLRHLVREYEAALAAIYQLR